MTTEPSLHNNTDPELVQRISNSDESAFNEFFSRYNLPIFNYIMRLTHQRSVAEDLLQEVFLAVWQGSKNFRGKSTVKTWIFRIAYLRSISWLRKNNKSYRVHQNIDDFFIQNNEPSPESLFIERWQNTQIRSAIARLSPNHRSVIELTFVHGFSQQEIAQIMKCPVGTVKSRMSYALSYLKTDISDHHNNEF